MKNKLETSSKFKLWKAEVKNQNGRQIKCLRTYNGTKYTKITFLKFCEEHGIRRHFIVKKTSQ